MSQTQMKISRRTFSRSAAIAAAASALRPLSFAQSSSQPTAAKVVETIKQHLNMTWNYKTYRDTFKAGDPNTPVKAIASCFMSTLDVLQRAHARGLNFVITHEPTFWSDADLIEPIKKDALYLEKLHFVESNGMVVWRIHDHWHRFRPEPMSTGNDDLLGWSKNPSDPRLYQFNPPLKLGAIAQQLATKLYTRSVRVIGDPEMMVTNLSKGGHALSATISGLETAEACFSSEMREWESAEYVRDLINSGEKKGYIVLSHEASEEEGMVVFTEFMKTAVPDLKTVFVPTNDRMYFA
jgi:putative NIF3 family GTP cyclohydrolase 1 type 2